MAIFVNNAISIKKKNYENYEMSKLLNEMNFIVFDCIYPQADIKRHIFRTYRRDKDQY